MVGKKVDLKPVHSEFCVMLRALGTTVFMDQFSFKYKVTGVFHVNTLRKQPEFSMADQEVIELGAGEHFS
jgi:hypothetical protein